MPATSRPLTAEESAALRSPERLAQLELSGLLDSPPEEAFDRWTRLAAQVLQVPVVCVNLLDGARVYSKSMRAPDGWRPAAETAQLEACCRWVVVSGEPLLVGDLARENGGAAPGEVRSYLAVPVGVGGLVLGTLTASDFVPREWSEREVGLLRDLAAGVVTEVELRLHSRERERVERMKDELVSVVAHELRTPLTAIRGSLGLLASGRMDPAGESARRLIAVAAESSERLVRIMNEMLDLEQLEAGAAELRMAPVSAAQVLARAAQRVSETPEGTRVRLVTRAEPGLMLVADADRIVQVLVNIAANAARYSAQDEVVELAAEQRGPEALLTVKDRGRGIPPEKLESIFERFVQVDSSDTRDRDRGGVGLGLAICRSIVRQHGGRIWVASELGRGSTFFFTVPARETPAASR